MIAPRLSWLLAFAALGCASVTPAASSRPPAIGKTPGGAVREGTPAEVDIVKARAKGLVRSFDWYPYAPETFALAKKEGKLILLDGAAEWCHWCHVMDATTYRDPEVGRILKERFITIRIDVDARPDLAERYGEWGWPATIIMNADAVELGKLRGYLPKEELLAVISAVVKGETLVRGPLPKQPGDRAATRAELGYALAQAVHSMDGFYDDEGAGWGRRQKAALGANLAIEARRARRGDARALLRVKASAAAHKQLIDPIWGGVYQYSDAGRWDRPHFEKLMPDQAANIEGFAEAYRATRDDAALQSGRAIAGYLTNILSSPAGSFYVSQDADVGAHDEKVPFIDGHVFYAKDDAGRRALGMPRIDTNVYAFENGLAIASLVNLSEAANDAALLAKARRAADVIHGSHVDGEGHVLHSADGARGLLFLADAASLGYALSELARVTNDDRYKAAALRIANAMQAQFIAPSGALFANTPDKGAVGVFAERRVPFEANALAARFYASLARVTGDAAWRERGIGVLTAITTPRGIDEQGRNLGGYLLAADDLGLLDSALAR